MSMAFILIKRNIKLFFKDKGMFFTARRKILCKRFSTKIKNGAGKQGGFWPESLGNRKP